jgi:hypothetical protein
MGVVLQRKQLVALADVGVLAVVADALSEYT